MRKFLSITLAALVLPVSIQIASADVPQVITYQGRLTNSDGATVPDGTYELIFTLYPDSLLPDLLWQEVQLIDVVGGLFDVQLGQETDLPLGPFIEIVPPNLYLGITLAGNPEMMPRIKLSSCPYAFKAFHSDEAGWAASSNVAGVAESVLDSAITEVSIKDGSIGLQDIGQNGAAPGQIIKWTPSGWDIGLDETGGSSDDGDWVLSDDILFTAGSWGIARPGNILYGNHDSTHINLGTACTTGTSGFSEWYVAVGGGYGNAATRVGSTVSGGFQNRASGMGATVGGGTSNYATYVGATVSGGSSNYATGLDATVAGGNVNMATADFTTIAGGIGNQTQDTIASVLGGKYNYATGVGSTIGGGSRNVAHGQYSFVGGGGGSLPYDSNAAVGDWSAVVGGHHNAAVGEESAVVGGYQNSASGYSSFVGSGGRNQAIGQNSVVAGGTDNEAHDGENTVSGGESNICKSRFSTIGGGSVNTTDGPPGSHACATVGGGHQNNALNQYATIAGGGYNEATARSSTVGGGIDNSATDSAAVVCGGGNNVARGKFSAVVGGGGDYGTQDSNAALAPYSFVGGGVQNVAHGDYSTIPGGRQNITEGDHSFAAGRRARALHNGCFVWADAMNSDFSSDRENEFAVYASNGFRVYANNSSLYGASIHNFGTGDGIRAYAQTSQGNIWAPLYAYNSGSSPGIYAHSIGGYAAYFEGDINVTGSVIKAGGSYKIDHPNDPAGKYLQHGFVGSSDQKNVYDGVVVLSSAGDAWIQLPEWFEALNGDFRYQLTAIGAPGPNLYIAEEISDNRFKIAGGSSGMKVSWQVTGIRRDAYADKHPLEIEPTKTSEERGKYLHPEEHGMSEASGINYRDREEKNGIQETTR